MRTITMSKMKKCLGFTLIELLIVIVIVAIIAAVAATFYTQFSQKGRRADGINAILNASLAEERYRSFNAQYGSLAQIDVASTSPQGYYTLSITNTGSNTYTIVATGVGSQANDKEGNTACSPLQLTVTNGTATRTPTGCWPT